MKIGSLLNESPLDSPATSSDPPSGEPIMHYNIAPPPISGRIQKQQPLNVLPPFTTLVNMPQLTATMVSTPKGVTSLRSNHQYHSLQTANGYLEVASYQTYTSSKDHYQHQPDPLMRFAEVAIESATLGGRQNLEDVAAAEVLTSQRRNMGSFIDIE
jgi:hypothetical protein